MVRASSSRLGGDGPADARFASTDLRAAGLTRQSGWVASRLFGALRSLKYTSARMRGNASRVLRPDANQADCSTALPLTPSSAMITGLPSGCTAAYLGC